MFCHPAGHHNVTYFQLWWLRCCYNIGASKAGISRLLLQSNHQRHRLAALGGSDVVTTSEPNIGAKSVTLMITLKYMSSPSITRNFTAGEEIEYRVNYASPWQSGIYAGEYSKVMETRKRQRVS